MTEDLQQLRTPDEFRVARPLLFPSEQSLAWFIRCNRAFLVEAGALTRPTGRWLVSPAEFDAAIASIGQRRARRE